MPVRVTSALKLLEELSMSIKFCEPHALHSAEYKHHRRKSYPQEKKTTDLSNATRVKKTGHTGNTETSSSTTKTTLSMKKS